MQKKVRNIGKFLALVLRHKPGVIGLALDPEGWLEVENLIAGCRKKGIDLDRETLTGSLQQTGKAGTSSVPREIKFELAKATPFRWIWA